MSVPAPRDDAPLPPDLPVEAPPGLFGGRRVLGRTQAALRDARLRALLLAGGVLAAMAVTGLLLRDRLPDLVTLGYPGIFLAGLVGAGTMVVPTFTLPMAFVLGGLPGFSPWLVGLAAGAGETLGELSGYGVGRGGHEGMETVRGFSRVEGWVQRWGLWPVFLVSLVPNPFVKAATVVAGASAMPLWQFLGVVFVGKTIKFTAMAWLGVLGVTTALEWAGRAPLP